ncbi:MAG: alpha/beta hydrolase [Nitrospiria bacterium]
MRVIRSFLLGGFHLAWVALWALAVFTGGCAVEKGFIFFPEKTLISTPHDVSLPYEDITLTAADGVRINAWYVPFQGSQKTLLWFHGNAGNIGNRVDLLHLLHRKLKVNILIIDYRGYGKSGGEISETGTALDARAAYDYLINRDDIDPRRIILFGRSLGAAVAVELATELQFGGLILESPFTSIRDMARERFSFLPVDTVIKTRYDSLSKIKSVHLPLLILHGDRDQIVPFQQGRRLFEAANRPKRFHTISNGGHNDTYVVGGRAYFEALLRFIEGI